VAGVLQSIEEKYLLARIPVVGAGETVQAVAIYEIVSAVGLSHEAYVTQPLPSPGIGSEPRAMQCLAMMRCELR